MSFFDAIKTGFQKYATFTGRARRAEYWYWTLFTILASACLTTLDYVIFTLPDGGPLNALFALVVLVPSITIAIRRMHDIDRSGWWLFLVFIPLVGGLVVLYWLIIKGTTGTNRFGEDPVSSGALVAA